METQLVYAELNGITFSMLEDALVCIISDGAVFMVTTQENSSQYPDEVFYPVVVEAIQAYGIELREGRVVQNYQK